MRILIMLCKVKFCGGSGYLAALDGWMDGFTSGYRVATALRIVYWPSLSLLGYCFAVSLVAPVNNPPQGYNCRESIIKKQK